MSHITIPRKGATNPVIAIDEIIENPEDMSSAKMDNTPSWSPEWKDENHYVALALRQVKYLLDFSGAPARDVLLVTLKGIKYQLDRHMQEAQDKVG